MGRMYYKCKMPSCNIRKYVDRDLTDPLVCKVTYRVTEGSITIPFLKSIENHLAVFSEFRKEVVFHFVQQTSESITQCYKLLLIYQWNLFYMYVIFLFYFYFTASVVLWYHKFSLRVFQVLNLKQQNVVFSLE
jgi:WRKY DNA -binding domain